MNSKAPHTFRILVIFVPLVASALWLAHVLTSRGDLPMYRDQTVEEWFFGRYGDPGRETTMDDARLVFAAMGTNCVPYLLDRVRVGEASVNGWYCRIYPKLPSVVQANLRPPRTASYVRMVALTHLRDLAAPRLDCFANQLLSLVPKISDDRARAQAYEVAQSVAIRLDDVEKRKAYFLSFLDDPDFGIRVDAAVMLSRIDSAMTNGVPILLTGVTNQETKGFFGVLPPAEHGVQVKLRQERALEALAKVAPPLASGNRAPE